MAPSTSGHSPAIVRSSDDLPQPLSPMTSTRSRWCRHSDSRVTRGGSVVTPGTATVTSRSTSATGPVAALRPLAHAQSTLHRDTPR